MHGKGLIFQVVRKKGLPRRHGVTRRKELNRKGRNGDARTARRTRTSLRPLRSSFASLRETLFSVKTR
ncbi:MAG: hypothetical protein AVDCRST_MAG56-548 [uncultured Cytophagales bacterium]|uniref:Uncharacterized protein n=1 Tax=uncultured Cytophagales bacterium TaxID=158755 RepID=A0A6J4HJH2_9SPHI|nr:MAG: hypothetical protein AVDCRST_MAG56-548 [uncultured Cytophagales bacterium]